MKKPAPIIGIVDDNEDVRQSISGLVRSAGYQATVFESLYTFLNSPSMRQTNCLIVNFKLLLNDLEFGISAVEAEMRSRALEHGAFQVFGEPFSIPIVTIEPRDEEAQTSTRKHGARTISGKPLSDVALLSAIRSALRSSQQEPDDLE
jgi:FixJ family two-component response regulator